MHDIDLNGQISRQHQQDMIRTVQYARWVRQVTADNAPGHSKRVRQLHAVLSTILHMLRG